MAVATHASGQEPETSPITFNEIIYQIEDGVYGA
jgi:hypothetical protein